MEKERISKRKLQAIETKKKIYEAARQLALNRGIGNISVDSIVEAAGVSKGAFYVHFESKDVLMTDFVNEYTSIADIYYASFLETLSDQKSTLDILALMAEKISDFIEGTIGYENMKVLYKSHLTKTINTTSAISYNRKLYEMFSEVLKRGVMQKELRDDIPVDTLAKHLILAIRGITFEWCVRYPDFDMKKQVMDHFKILLYGLKR